MKIIPFLLPFICLGGKNAQKTAPSSHAIQKNPSLTFVVNHKKSVQSKIL